MVALKLNVEHLKRYKDIAWLLMKYGRSDLVKQAGLEEILREENTETTAKEAAAAGELAADLEKLGGTYIKLGQLLSTRADLLPPAYLEALSRLQDNIEPFPYEEVERIVSEEVGVRISKAFTEFEKEPLGAASIGQVHRAKLRSGQSVVVKVQRPGIREQIVLDLEALEEVASFLDAHTEAGKRYEFQSTLAELRKSLFGELDYQQEATNLTTIANNLKDFDRIAIPLPVDDYTTSRVLTMQYIEGKKITSLSPLALQEIDGRGLARELFNAYLKQILVDGFFHADPHPGNIFITEAEQIALLDLGMVGRLLSSFQDNLLVLLLAISEGRGEDAARTAIKMGESKKDFDEPQFLRRIGDIVSTHKEADLKRIDAGKVALEITRISAECGFRLPMDFTLVAKAFLNLDLVVYTLDPQFNPNEAIRDRASEILRERMLKSVSPGTLLSNAIEVKEFAEKLPTRINNILDVIGNNELEIKVDAIDEKTLMEGFQKIANRITMGLILTALIIGASLLMRVETSFRIFGYPGLPILFFIGAAAGGVALIISIIFTDQKAKKRSSAD
jgi:ubiquinone biosynthesis protein